MSEPKKTAQAVVLADEVGNHIQDAASKKLESDLVSFQAYLQHPSAGESAEDGALGVSQTPEDSRHDVHSSQPQPCGAPADAVEHPSAPKDRLDDPEELSISNRIKDLGNRLHYLGVQLQAFESELAHGRC